MLPSFYGQKRISSQSKLSVTLNSHEIITTTFAEKVTERT
jgi:hypothetical protein